MTLAGSRTTELERVGALAVPEVNDHVVVRGRPWIVTEVVPNGLPASDLSASPTAGATAVRLVSLDEDSMGEESTVVWDLEPGRSRNLSGVAELPGPDRIDDAHDLGAFLDAVRWGAVSSADPRAIQSPFRSGISIEDYQLEPVVRAIRMPRANLLIADDVGLGKTIEAGLVAQELLTRHRIQQVLIICPASLQLKWKDEMREKFGLDFEIADTDLLKHLRRERGPHVNPWSHHPRLITSMDWIKREGHGGPLQLFRETLPGPGEPLYPRRYGLLIIDEAHNVAPSGNTKYAVDSQRTSAIRTIAPHFEHRLFLTATPHNGKPESFSALLNLLDDQRFVRGLERQDHEQVDAVVVRRLKTDLKDEEGNPRFQPRKIEAVEVQFEEAEHRLYSLLEEYARYLREDLPAGAGKPTEFVLEILKKRLLSSAAAFLHTLQKHRQTLQGQEGESSTKKRSRAMPGVLQRFVEDTQVEYCDDEEYEEDLDGAIGTATSFFETMGDRGRELLAEMIKGAEAVARRADSKCKALTDLITRSCRPNGTWNDERLIVFTEYRATQKWLIGRLAELGIRDGDGLRVLYGGMDEDEREHIKQEFQAHPRKSDVRILLATDMASEGIDLQNHCHRMVHYEIPWNPSVLEQRNGRIDRHGQRHRPLVFHFVASNRGGTDALAGDQAFLARVVRKLEEQSRDLSGRVNEVIAHQVKEGMRGTRRELEVSDHDAADKVGSRILVSRRNIAEEVAKLRDQLRESREELHVGPAEVQRVVELGLRLAGQPPLRPTKLDRLVPSSETAKGAPRAFHLPALRDGWSRCSEGILHPLTGEKRPITFDHSVAEGHDDVVLAHLNHPLVQMSQRLLRAEVHAGAGHGRLARFAVRRVPADEVEGPTALVWGRLLVLGGDGHRLHEELICAAVRYRDGRTRRIDTVMEVERLESLDGTAGEEHDASVARELWPEVGPSLADALSARATTRTENLESIVERRTKDEVAKVESIFEELTKQIEAALKGRKVWQLELKFEGDKDAKAKDQFERDTESLRRELDTIPSRRDEEVRQVELRFADPRPRHFPVAAQFLVPDGWKRR